MTRSMFERIVCSYYFAHCLGSNACVAPNILRLPTMKVGQPLLNINITKGKNDPILLKDEEYPTWIWDSLNCPEKAEMLDDDKIVTKSQKRAVNRLKLRLQNFKKQLNPDF